MKQVIDIEHWERKDNFNFFRHFQNPQLSITSEVECGGAKKVINSIPADGDPYAAENSDATDGEYDLILLSATPDLYFTSLTATLEKSSGNNYPLLNAGKAIIREGKLVMPIAITIHHGFVDGHHLSLFYKKVENYLK